MSTPLDGLSIFISASVPDPNRWAGDFDAFEITEAVTALTSAFISAGADIVTAAHPTIAPLIITVARRLPELERHRHRIWLYQSEFFRGKLPAATTQLMRESLVRVTWTSIVAGADGEPDRDGSLRAMRKQMLHEQEPSAAVFVGGMEGIFDEHQMLSTTRPQAALYPLRAPGGEAANLPATEDLEAELGTSRLYPYLADLLVDDLASRLPDQS
jgi:hypothetical protein